MDLVTIESLAAVGAPRERPSRLARAGALAPVRPGAYLDAEVWAVLSEEDRHVARMRAALRVLRASVVFSHESAAVVHGIPLLGGVPPRPCVTVAPGGTNSSSLVRRVHRILHAAELTTSGGFRVTTVLRTVVDLAATTSPLAGIVAISHARRHLGVSLDGVFAALGASRPFPGARRAAAAARASTDRSDSALEALVLTRIRDLGFAEPEQQRELLAGGRRYRVDFAWEAGSLVLEADGRLKYDRPEVLWDEKQREDSIRGLGTAVARTTWADAWDGRGLERRLIDLGVPRTRRARPLTR